MSNNEPFDIHLRDIDIESLMKSEFAKRHGIVVPWLAEGEICLLYALRGVGKTFFAMWLSASIALGYKFLGWGIVKKRVLYIDGEMGLAGAKKRFEAIFQALGQVPTKQYLRLCSYPEDGVFPNISLKEVQDRLDEIIDAFDVIVVDNLLTTAYRAFPRDDEFRIWERIQPWFISLRERGKTVILVHHSAKSGDQSGTIMKENICDVVIKLSPQRIEEHHGCSFLFDTTKERNFIKSEDTAKICKLVSDPPKWIYSGVKEARANFVIRKLRDGWSHTDIGQHLFISKAEVKDLEKIAKEDVTQREDIREIVQEEIDWNEF